MKFPGSPRGGRENPDGIDGLEGSTMSCHAVFRVKHAWELEIKRVPVHTYDFYLLLLYFEHL